MPHSTFPSFGSSVIDYDPARSGNTSFHTEITVPDAQDDEQAQYFRRSSNHKAALLPLDNGEHSDRISSSEFSSWDSDTIAQVIDLADAADKAIPDRIASVGRLPEHHKVRNLPEHGLCSPDFEKPPTKPGIPFFILFECARVSIESKLPLQQVLSHLPEQFEDYDKFWEEMRQKPFRLPKQCPPTAWLAAASKNSGVSVNGRLSFTSSEKMMFSLSLEPLRIDKSCRFQRKFGGDRFLFLLVPGLLNLPANIPNQQDHFRRRFLEWMLTEKNFLGRVWRVVHIEKYKPPKGQKAIKEKQNQIGYRLILFSISGSDIPDTQYTGLYDLINWFMSLNVDHNLKLPYCKAYARLDLGFSKTLPAHGFLPSQVRQVGDIMSDRTREATEFNDPTFTWPPEGAFGPQPMNDGCCEISLGACREMWKALNNASMIPSVFQARINGAKGVWIRSAPTDSADPRHQDMWIDINSSQRKFSAHAEDVDSSFDEKRWTFELLRASGKPSMSSLHLAFIPILVDRGVSESNIEKLIRDVLDYERVELLQALENPCVFRSWLQSHTSSGERRPGGLPWEAGLPVSPVEKVIFLLEHGFTPMNLQFMAKEINEIIWRYFARVIKSFSVRLSCSTNLIGIADPTGSLRPGEIHLAFSEGFQDERSQDHYQFLQKEVLVSRHPALRPSDIQKVRAVYKTQLSHLLDVVVFPSVGSIPLASKLQGGDYDGDIFWVCWEPSLVKGFRNAPAPVNSPQPEEFGIRVDKRSLFNILSEVPRTRLSPIDNLLSKCFDFRLNDELLGYITFWHERLSFAKNSISDPGVMALADLHDYLIDSSKNGYTYSEQDFKNYVTRNPMIPDRMPPEAAYKQDIESWQQSARRPISSFPATFESAHMRRSPEKQKPKTQINQKNILDRIHFDIIKPHVQATLQMVAEKLSEHSSPTDPELYEPYQRELRSEDPEIVGELQSLKKALHDLHKEWSDAFRYRADDDEGASVDPDFFAKTLEICHDKFKALKPQNTQNPIIRRWMDSIGNSHSWWSLLKASALASTLSTRDRFVFSIAGDLLGYLKAQYSPRHRILVEDIWNVMKPKKVNAKGLELDNKIGMVIHGGEDDLVGDDEDDDFDDFHSSFEDIL